MDARARADFEAYLAQHPEERQQVNALRNVLGLLGSLHDKEVIAPPLPVAPAPRATNRWLSGPLKTMMGMAASLLVLLVAAHLLGMQINHADGRWQITFRQQPKQPATGQSLTKDEVASLVAHALAQQQVAFDKRLQQRDRDWQRELEKTLAASNAKIDGLIKNNTVGTQQQVQAFVAGLQEQNLKTMQQYLQLSNKEQNKYVENLLVDFAKYLQEQRHQDLQFLQARVQTVEKNTDELKQETEQILASIISGGGVEKSN